MFLWQDIPSLFYQFITIKLLIPVAFEVLGGGLLSILSECLQDQYQIRPKHIKQNYLYFNPKMTSTRNYRYPRNKFTDRTGCFKDPNLPQAKKHTSWCQNHSVQYNFKGTNSLGHSFYCLHFSFNLEDITYGYVSKIVSAMLKEINRGWGWGVGWGGVHLILSC